MIFRPVHCTRSKAIRFKGVLKCLPSSGPVTPKAPRSKPSGNLHRTLHPFYANRWIMSEIIRDERCVTIRPGRDIVASMAGEFRSELNGEIAENLEELTIDLSGVEMVDSVGIGVIIATHNTLDQQGAKLKVINIADDIYGLFTTMRLDRHFTIEKMGEPS